MRHSIEHIFSRLGWLLVVIVGVSILTFLLIRSVPGNPWQAGSQRRALGNLSMDAAAIRTLDRQFGLDKPLWQQYTGYMFGSLDETGTFYCGAMCGNLGPSLRQRGRPVVDVIFGVPEGFSPWHSRFGYTLRLAFFGVLLTTLVGIPLGISMAIRSGTRFEHGATLLITLLSAIPNFILGILLVIVLASWLDVIPVIPDWDMPGDWVVPVLVLAAIPTANLARLTQTALQDAMQGDYVRTARAKGLQRFRVVYGHVLPNAIAPIVTALAPALIELIAGSFIVEALFSFPGIGSEYWKSVSELDFPMVMGLTLIYAVGIIGIHMIVDALYGVIDPRLRNQ
jgi:oligopeptide transport system permease protein